jgi:sigma-E factor negative regulatory protein RseC
VSELAGLLVREGRVESVDGQSVTVRVAAAGSCARCARGEGCGFGFAAAQAEDGRLVLPRPASLRAAPGDTVRVALDQQGLAGAAAAVYGIPLAGLLAGSLAATALGLGDGAATGLALAAFAASLPLARGAARRAAAAGRCQPRLLAAARTEAGGHA